MTAIAVPTAVKIVPMKPRMIDISHDRPGGGEGKPAEAAENRAGSDMAKKSLCGSRAPDHLRL